MNFRRECMHFLKLFIAEGEENTFLREPFFAKGCHHIFDALHAVFFFDLYTGGHLIFGAFIERLGKRGEL